jgi:adenylate kinase family enzyme
VERVVVTGPAGAGKSELARRLGEALGLPVLHLDTLFWKPGWVPTPPEEWEALQRRELAADAWIADAQYDDVLPDWVSAADTVVVLDVSPLRCLWRLGRRRLNRAASTSTPSGTQPGAVHRALLKFVRNQWVYRRRVRRELLDELSRARNGRRLVVVRRESDASAFLRDVDSPPCTGGTV